MRIGAVILAGGKSRRMRSDKAQLSIEGQSFLEHTVSELSCFDELLLSVRHDKHYPHIPLRAVEDIYPETGPMGGIYSALCACRSDALFVSSCDMPLVTSAFVQYICAQFADGYDAVVPVSRDGRIHPLCALYSKSSAKTFKKQIEEGNYRMRDALEHMNVRYVSLAESLFSDDLLFNVNQPEDYALLNKLIEKREQP